MKLIIGLGNPGNEYENTRHNIGFRAIDEIAKSMNTTINQKKFDGLYTKLFINGQNIILLKPQKYMNLSGEVIKKYVDFFKIDMCDILVISDDLDMKVGLFKLKYKGSSGGHNGLKDIELNLNTQNYKRLKIGISNDKNINTKNYVLGKISTQEKEIFNKIFDIIPNIFNDYLNLNFDQLMNKYNKKNI